MRNLREKTLGMQLLVIGLSSYSSMLRDNTVGIQQRELDPSRVAHMVLMLNTS